MLVIKMTMWRAFSTQVRVENVENPSDYIEELIARVKTQYLEKTYKVASWSSAVDFLEQLAVRSGKLLKVREQLSLYQMQNDKDINYHMVTSLRRWILMTS